MKNLRYIFISVTALTVMLGSCKKDYLDEYPSEQTSSEQIDKALEQDPLLLNGSIAGLYSAMYNLETGGTEDHDDFGQKGYDIYADMLSGDMALIGINYGWYTPVVRFQASKDFTLEEAYKPWRYYYRIVLAANTVVDALGGNDAEPEDEDQRHIMGQAKGMRGYAYFYLSQLYSAGYGTGNERILPLYVDTQSPNQPLSTTAQVYDRIISDLTDAVELLDGFSRGSNKNAVNQDVARGLLAYAYAARGTNADLDQVITLTNEVMQAGYRMVNRDEVVARLDANGNLLNPTSGFNNVNNASWIWGADLTNAANLDLISWWGQVDLFTYSYAWAGDPKVIDQDLYEAIRDDDLRKGQFDEDYDLMPINKFFDPARIEGGQRVVTTDYVYMRYEEMLLLNAEAKARLGQNGPARDELKRLLALRLTDYAYVDALSGQALLDEIFLQTRIELWGEGKSYLALKRNKRSIKRGGNHLFEAGVTFSYNSPEMTLPIPQAEILNNPNLNK